MNSGFVDSDFEPASVPSLSKSTKIFNQIAIIGVGLMGGSLGMAVLERGLADSVIGFGRNEESLNRAVERKAVSSWSLNYSDLASADLIVICVPVGSIPAVLRSIQPFTTKNALITDMGSTKQSIMLEGDRLFGFRFVGSHPMAGSELSGIDAARSDLFVNAAWAVVGSERDNDRSEPEIARMIQFAAALGSRPIRLNASDHDSLVALVSHLPHLLSFSFAKTVADASDPKLAKQLSAGSYKDIMRVAASDPELWRDIFIDTRTALIDILTKFEQNAQLLRRLIEQEKSEDILNFIQIAAASASS